MNTDDILTSNKSSNSSSSSSDRPGGADRRLPGGARLRAAGALLLVAALCGCQPQPRGSQGGGAAAARKPPGPGSALPPLTPDAIKATDLCAERLQDVEGALLDYYALNHHLPERLDELKSLAGFGTELNFTCPVSKKPYVYTPAGLEAAGRAKRIIVHDAEPVHDGKRWCIMMPPVKPGQQPFMEVLLIEEKDFRAYMPISRINP